MNDYENRLQYCGNCSHHIEHDQELYCGLDPKIVCCNYAYANKPLNPVFRRFLKDSIVSNIKNIQKWYLSKR